MHEQVTNSDIITAYDEFYAKHDDAWRMLGAKYKAQNIIKVCKGHTYKKVLEVGAGTGGTTAGLLPRLQGREVEYFFTDLSPLFLSEAKSRFQGLA